MQPILKIDLTANKIESFTVPAEYERDFLGGASLGARLLFDSLTREIDPPFARITSPDSERPTFGYGGPSRRPFRHLWQESCHRLVGGVELWRFFWPGTAHGRLGWSLADGEG